MNFEEWADLNADDRRLVKWHRKPHIRTATLFTIVLTLLAFLFVVRIGKNETSHLNRKPNADEAYRMAQNFVKDKLKLPASADFSMSSYKSDIDTATNIYRLNGDVNAQGIDGHFIKQHWSTRLKYTGGDWANRKSWEVDDVDVQ